MNNVDLTSAGNNTQFFLEFGSIQRLPVQNIAETAASISIQVTDANGVTGNYNTGISNVIGFNVVLNFNCSPGQSACFSPQPNFTNVTNVTVEVRYPQSQDLSGASLTTVLDQIRTTPTGGIAPSAPSPSVTAPSSTVYGELGDTVTFDVAFTSTTGPAAVTNEPPSSTGLRAQDVVTRGTAGGRNAVVVSGGPATYQVTLGPITSVGTLGIDIPAGVVTDVWGQDNVASGATPTVDFQLGIPPVLNTAGPPPFLVGAAGSFQFTSTGMPAPTFEAVGSLPEGLSLAPNGTLSGTPAPGTRGPHEVTVLATNAAGTNERSYPLVIRELPFLAAPTDVDARVGTEVSFTATYDGYPAPALTTGTLPSWLTRTDNGPGSTTLSGTPPLSAVGDLLIQLTATNVAGQAQQSVTLHVDPISTSVSVAIDELTVVYGQEVTATATVTSPVPGTVQFSVDGDDVGVPVAVPEDTATSPPLTDPSGEPLAADSYTVGASFLPSSPGAAPSSTTVPLVVMRAATTTAVDVTAGKMRRPSLPSRPARALRPER